MFLSRLTLAELKELYETVSQQTINMANMETETIYSAQPVTLK